MDDAANASTFLLGFFISRAQIAASKPERATIGNGAARRKEKAMIKRSCEDPRTIYIRLPWARYIFRAGKYVGWYRPKVERWQSEVESSER